MTLSLVLLTAVSALAWGLAVQQALKEASPAESPRAPFMSAPALPSAAELARLLGGAAAPDVAAASPAQRFVLLGVIARASGQGVALIAVDGQPAKPFAAGTELAPGFVLRQVSAREALLASVPGGPIIVRLSLPDPSATEPGPFSQPPAQGAQTSP